MTLSGRRTGGVFYTFPVQYVRDGRTLWVNAGGAGKTWWRNLADSADVEVHLRRRTHRGRAIASRWDRDPDGFAEGMARYVERFPRMSRRLRGAAADADTTRIGEQRPVMVRIDLED